MPVPMMYEAAHDASANRGDWAVTSKPKIKELVATSVVGECFVRFELTTWSYDIVVHDLHGDRATALRSRINGEGLWPVLRALSATAPAHG